MREVVTLIRRLTAFLAGCLLSGAALAGEAPAPIFALNAVDFPAGRSVTLDFMPRPGAPAATLKARVTYEEGQARVEIAFDGMKPAILYGGDVTCYVLWAVTRDGQAENLGELVVESPGGRLEVSTGKKEFALLVTAEPYNLVGRPSALVLFLNGASPDRGVTGNAFAFGSFAPAPAHDVSSIAAMTWDSTLPLALLQARKAYEIATRHDAATQAPDIYGEAGEALAEANRLALDATAGRRLQDQSRRAVALSNLAINIAAHRREEVEVEAALAARRAEMATLEQRAREAEDTARQNATRADELRAELQRLNTDKESLTAEVGALTAQKRDLDVALKGLRTERESLQAAQRNLNQEKSELSGRLEKALSHVAETRRSARGLVLNLPDILFDLDKATLKRDAEQVLAKLAGILLALPDLQVRIEGHTDSLGSADYNLKLSRRRAETVRDFLGSQGVAKERLTAEGFGKEQPIADNYSEEGRRRNRRVEIVIKQ
jgi:outer membrane protein OmpA-like peptidoglycan-associated protein